MLEERRADSQATLDEILSDCPEEMLLVIGVPLRESVIIKGAAGLYELRIEAFYHAPKIIISDCPDLELVEFDFHAGADEISISDCGTLTTVSSVWDGNFYGDCKELRLDKLPSLEVVEMTTMPCERIDFVRTPSLRLVAPGEPRGGNPTISFAEAAGDVDYHEIVLDSQVPKGTVIELPGSANIRYTGGLFKKFETLCNRSDF